MMKTNIKDLAIFGSQPSFAKPLPVGQINMPSFERFKEKFCNIFDNRYYTNQGPMTNELEKKLSDFLNVKHAICVTNATMGLLMTAKALGLKGKVIVPSFTFIATAQSLSWCGLEPVFCDIDKENHLLDILEVKKIIDKNKISAILGVHMWGGNCHSDELQKLAKENNIKLYYDAAHAFGCVYGGINIGNFGEAEIFSFHATKILNASEGGCICTNDDQLAEKIRNIRSSYGIRKIVDIPLTGNARMSEAQAAMALLSLEDYNLNQDRNRVYFSLYEKELSNVEGLKIIRPKRNEGHNYQYIVFEVNSEEFGMTRDLLLGILEAENIICRKYFTPGCHMSYPYEERYSQYIGNLHVTEKLCNNVFQVPSGDGVTKDDVMKICNLIRLVQRNSSNFLEK